MYKLMYFYVKMFCVINNILRKLDGFGVWICILNCVKLYLYIFFVLESFCLCI